MQDPPLDELSGIIGKLKKNKVRKHIAIVLKCRLQKLCMSLPHLVIMKTRSYFYFHHDYFVAAIMLKTGCKLGG